MTTARKSGYRSVTVIWPERETETDYEYEHAIVISRWTDSVVIQQRGAEITVPAYALRELILALREEERVARLAEEPKR